MSLQSTMRARTRAWIFLFLWGGIDRARNCSNAATVDCPDASWITDGNQCFKIWSYKNMRQCVSTCRAMGADIASKIPAGAALTNMHALWAKTNSADRQLTSAALPVWVGLTDYEEEQKWQWLTGGDNDNLPWECSRPVNRRNCAVECASVSINTGELSEARCSDKLPCLCEISSPSADPMPSWAQDFLDESDFETLFRSFDDFGECYLEPSYGWTIPCILGLFLLFYSSLYAAHALNAHEDRKEALARQQQREKRTTIRRSHSVVEIVRMNKEERMKGQILRLSNSLNAPRRSSMASLFKEPRRSLGAFKHSVATILHDSRNPIDNAKSSAAILLHHPRKSFDKMAQSLSNLGHAKVLPTKTSHGEGEQKGDEDDAASDLEKDALESAEKKRGVLLKDKFALSIDTSSLSLGNNGAPRRSLSLNSRPQRSSSLTISTSAAKAIYDHETTAAAAVNRPRPKLQKVKSFASGEVLDESVSERWDDWHNTLQDSLALKNRRPSLPYLMTKPPSPPRFASPPSPGSPQSPDPPSPLSPQSPAFGTVDGSKNAGGHTVRARRSNLRTSRRRFSSFAIGRSKATCVAALQYQLEEANRAGEQLRRRITRRSRRAGIFLMVSGIVLLGVSASIQWRTNWHSITFNFALLFLILACFILLLSVMPYDHGIVASVCQISRYAGMAIVMLYVILGAWSWPAVTSCDGGFDCPNCLHAAVDLFQNLAQGAIAVALMVHMGQSLDKQSVRSMLDSLWKAAGLFFVKYGCVGLLCAIAKQKWWQLLPTMSAMICGKAMASEINKVSVRAYLQSWLSSFGQAVTTAAAIASMLGDHKISVVHTRARQQFRYVEAGDMREEEMADSTPDPKLFGKTKPALLGEVDAFMSHSWSDDPKAKWAEFQEWRQEFVVEMGREPKLWVDKYCIDQRKINENLLCLPVFLAGCHRLVVFAGPSYLDRLWCLVELYVFLQIGGYPENIDLALLGGNTEGDKAIVDGFARVQSATAKCYLPADRERLSTAIEVGFGDTETFDFTISNVLSEVCLRGHHLGRAAVPTLESLSSQNSFHDSALQSLSKGRESFTDTLAKGRDSFIEGLKRPFRLASNSDVSDGADDDLDKAIQAKPVVGECKGELDGTEEV